MKLIVFGATGGIGAHVVEQALAAGHEVTAVARRPSAITLKHERLNVVQGDVLDEASIRRAIVGKDVVVSAVGARDRNPTTVYSAGVANMMQAMQAAHVSRIFCISASGLDPAPLWQRLIAKPLLWFFLKNMYTDLVRMENEVSSTRLDWTILRPPQLTDGPRTGHYQSAVNKRLARILKISRADVADYIVTHLDDKTTYRGLVELAY
ncbi:MAG TPA: SDR family oxidoreductase [Phototrophicaceae bacterium]|jgi:putative NADH-flavin reductase|nr:SDR family oxidoreductase [Phototrophicaceae bacterium]